MDEKPWHRHYDFNVPTSLRIPHMLAQDILDIPANAYPNKAAVSFLGSEISFKELRRLSLRMANALGGLGIRKGDRVGLHLPNSPQFLIAHFATLYLGAIVVGFNPMYHPAEIQGTAEDTGVKVIFTCDETLETISQLCEKVDIEHVIVTRLTDFVIGQKTSTAKDFDLPPGWRHFSELLADHPQARLPRVEIDVQDPAVIIFTGGTTGTPKGAVTSHHNVVAAALTAFHWALPKLQYIPFEKRTVMAIAPYFHSNGCIMGNYMALINCATQIVVPRFQIDEFMDTISKFEQITFFSAFPTLINAMINHPKAEEIDLGGKLRLLGAGGQACPKELIHQAKEIGVSIFEGYGMTEAAGCGTINPILGLKKIGSVGVPLPNSDIKIVDLDNGLDEVPIGESGEIIIKSPMVMKEYWGKPEETAEQLRGGWLYSGDIGLKDEDHFFYIVDRKKDMIIASGYNIYPREIDEVLYQHPKVKEAIAVGIPDPYRGETVKAYVVLKPGQTATDQEIIAFSREKLAAYKAPKMVEFRDSLPQSSVGKIVRKMLREEEEAKLKDEAAGKE